MDFLGTVMSHQHRCVLEYALSTLWEFLFELIKYTTVLSETPQRQSPWVGRESSLDTEPHGTTDLRSHSYTPLLCPLHWTQCPAKTTECPLFCFKVVCECVSYWLRHGGVLWQDCEESDVSYKYTWLLITFQTTVFRYRQAPTRSPGPKQAVWTLIVVGQRLCTLQGVCPLEIEWPRLVRIIAGMWVLYWFLFFFPWEARNLDFFTWNLHSFKH